MASFRTKVMPWPGYTVLEQNQHFSRRITEEPLSGEAQGPSGDALKAAGLQGSR